jgi:hypothetical protein
MLVDQLVALGPSEISSVVRQLLPLGNFALEEIAKAFPGPLWRPALATDSRLPRPQEVSASAAALLAFDHEAIPYLIRLVGHDSTTSSSSRRCSSGPSTRIENAVESHCIS